MPRRPLTALTLLETVVTTALVALAAVLTFTLFHRVFRFCTLGMERSSAAQQATQTYRQWLRDMELATPNSLTWRLDVGPERLRFLAVQPIQEVTTEARPLYARDRLIVYRYAASNRALWRQDLSGRIPGVTLDPDAPERIPGTQLLALPDPAASPARRLDNVARFDLGSTLPEGLLNRHLHPSLEVTLTTANGRPQPFRIEQDFMLPACP